MNAPVNKSDQASTAPALLPDVGSFGIALRIVFVAELIALLFTVARNTDFNAAAWQDFSFLSMFAMGVGVACALALKLVAPFVKGMRAAPGALVLFLVLIGTIALVTEGLIYALYYFDYVAERWPDWHWSLLGRTVLTGAAVSALGLRYLIVAHRAALDAKAEQEARMQALQSRIRPHFLFNSMNSIASLTRSDPARAEAALQDLADLFRVLLADARKLVPISAEREISRQYLEIEKLRLGDRLKVTWNVSNIPRNALVPALTLQPLLENAIYHGIEPRFGGGTVKIDMWTEGEVLNFMISNPLPEVPKHAHGKGNKIAMDNIRQRLASHFGADASMQSFEEGNQYHVKVKMPVLRG